MKKPPFSGGFKYCFSPKLASKVAEGVGFEPTVACATTVFKTVTIGHSDTPPMLCSTVRRFSPNSQTQSATRMDVRSLVEGFLLDCKVTGKSFATIDYYTEKLNKFLWYVDTFGLPSCVTSIAGNHIREFLAYARTTDKERWGSKVTKRDSNYATRFLVHMVDNYLIPP